MKLKNVKAGQRVQVKESLPCTDYNLYNIGDVGTIVSEVLHGDYGMCAGEPSDKPVKVLFDGASTPYWVNAKRLRKVKQQDCN